VHDKISVKILQPAKDLVHDTLKKRCIIFNGHPKPKNSKKLAGNSVMQNGVVKNYSKINIILTKDSKCVAIFLKI
jgi:hypothetical protein